MSNQKRLNILLAYLTVYIIWGSTYLFIRWSVESIPPFYLVGARFLAGGLVFLSAAFFMGKLKHLPDLKQILSALFQGTFLLLLGNGFVSVGEKNTESYLAALIIATTPFMISFFNYVLFKQKLSLSRLAGICAGVAGVWLILYDGHGVFPKLTTSVLLVLAGLLCWSFATSIGHKLPSHPNHLIHSGMQMLFIGIISAVLSGFIYPPADEIIPLITVRSWISLAYLTVFGALAFFAYNYLISKEPSYRISSYAIVNPGLAVLLGLLFAGEKAAPLLWAGFPLMILGLIIMFYGDSLLLLIKNKKLIRMDANNNREIIE
jgi:drug/metabolite transporter (DMT)-like permease